MPSRAQTARSPGRRIAAALVFAVAILGLPAIADAAPSKIVFGCAPDICAVDPDSGVAAAITSDGAASPYGYPSVSRSGGTVAATRGADIVAGPYGSNLTQRWGGERDINDLAISPDGASVAESHSYVVNRYGCPLTGGCLELVDMSETFFIPAAGAGPISYPGGGGVGFLGAGALLSSLYTLSTDLHHICVAATPAAAGSPCEPRISSTSALGSPDGSPDGGLIAVMVADPPPAATSSVVLYNAASGAAVRTVAANAGSPTFSPDGSAIAYAGGDGWIYTVGVGGGTPRRLVRGIEPSWGGGDGPGPRLAAKKLRLRKGAVPVRVGCGAGDACRGTVELRKGRKAIGSRAFRLRAGKRGTVRVKPTRKGAKLLAKRAKQRLTVVVKPRGGRAVASKLTLRR